MTSGDRALEQHLRDWAAKLSLEPGAVLELIGGLFGESWFYLLVELDFEGDCARLLRLDYDSNDSLRPGTLSHVSLEDLLDDLYSSKEKEGIHWRKL